MKSEPTRISVIIPIYKAEQTLDRCLSSVIQQPYANLEVILVDDGSPDRCPEMCDRYAREDGRIHVVHQKNKGVGAARNAGMSVMTGDYLLFIDADDYFVPETIATLYAETIKTGADITIGNLFESVGHGHFKKAPSFQRERITAEQQALPRVRYELFYDPGYGVTAWNKLYRTDFLTQHKIAFEELPSFSEDYLFNMRCFIRRPRIQLVNRYTYVYCTDASTITRSKILDPIEKSLRSVKSIKDALEGNQLFNEYEDLLAWFIFGQINQIARNFSIHHDHAFNEIRNFLTVYKKNETVSRYIREISSGKHLDGANRESWKRYAKNLSRLLSRDAYAAASSILLLRFKIQDWRLRKTNESN